MSDRPPLPSQRRVSRAVAVRHLLTSVVIVVIIGGTVGVIAWFTRPTPDMSGTPVVPSTRTDATSSPGTTSAAPTTNPERITFVPGGGDPALRPQVTPDQLELTEIQPDLGQPSAVLLHQAGGVVEGVRWKSIERSLPTCSMSKHRYPGPDTISASRVRVGLAKDGVVDEEILIEFVDKSSAKRFMQALRSAITSCQYDMDPETSVVTHLEDDPGLGREAFILSSWSYEFVGQEWILAPGAGIGVWARQGKTVVGAGRSSGYMGDPRGAPEIGFETVPRIAIEHVLAQLS